MTPKGASNILLIRLSAIGDIVMASGLPIAIKQVHPNATITWIVESPYRALVEQIPGVDKTLVWPKQEWKTLVKTKQWRTLYRAFCQFRQHLKQAKYDLVIDAQGLLKSALVANFTASSYRLGFVNKEQGHRLLTHSVSKVITDEISSEYRYLAKWFGAHNFTLDLTIDEQYHREANHILSRRGVNSPYVVICPFTTRPQKHWPLANWQHVIEHITHNLGLFVVVVGGAADIHNAATLARSNGRTCNFTGKSSITTSAAIIAGAQACIGVDTGMTHIAVVLNKPTIALFGSTAPYLRTDNPNAKVLYKGLSCSPCKRSPTCHGRFTCMADISVSDVCSALECLL